MMSSMGRRYPTLHGARHLHQQEASLEHPLVISAPRSSSTAAASAATTHLVHTTRLRTLATTVFIRGIATRSGKESATVTKPEVEPLTLGEFKNEMTTLIDREVKESSTVLDPAAEYLAQLNYSFSVSDGVATLKRAQGKQVIEVSFAVEEESEEEEGEGENEEEEDDDDDDEEATMESVKVQDIDLIAGVKDLYIPAEVKITIVDKTGNEVSSMAVSCSAYESRFFIDTLYSADGKNSVHFEQFSEDLQEKIYDYLESLKLDNSLGTFIYEYVRNYHAHKSAQVLNDLKQFVSHLRDE